MIPVNPSSHKILVSVDSIVQTSQINTIQAVIIITISFTDEGIAGKDTQTTDESPVEISTLILHIIEDMIDTVVNNETKDTGKCKFVSKPHSLRYNNSIH